MNKVIEANFLPREPDGDFSWPGSTPTSKVGEKRRILIVDNDTNATHLVRILLEKTGQYLVLEENNSIKAHQSARIFRPDLILLDVVMPIRDGGEIAAQIQADPKLQKYTDHFPYGARYADRSQGWRTRRRASISCQASQYSRVEQRHR